MLFGQLPGADDAISAAARDSWVAVLLVTIVVATFGTFGIVIRTIMREASEREARLNARIDSLQDFIRGDLLDALRENTQAILAMNITVAHCKDKAES